MENRQPRPGFSETVFEAARAECATPSWRQRLTRRYQAYVLVGFGSMIPVTGPGYRFRRPTWVPNGADMTCHDDSR